MREEVDYHPHSFIQIIRGIETRGTEDPHPTLFKKINVQYAVADTLQMNKQEFSHPQIAH